MGALMRSHDWSASSLGPPSAWPQSLRTAVRLLLNTGHPMYIWWGQDGACLYNDAYRESIGPERHPQSLGQPARQVWEEIWDIIGPQIEQVMAGGPATWNENHLVPITRHGRREDVYWTYSYSPIDDESVPGGVGGVLVVCTETTQNVMAKKRLALAIERQRRLFQCAPGFIAILRGPNHIFEFVNDAYIQLAGDRDYIGRPALDAVPDIKDQGYKELLDQVYATGERFVAQQKSLRLARTPGASFEERFIDFIYEPIVDADGSISGIFVEGFDVTDRALADAALRESESRLRELNMYLEREVMERSAVGGRFWQISPDLLGVLSVNGQFESVNPAWLNVLGWTETEIEGISFVDLLHPDERHELLEAFERLEKGKPITRFECRYRRKDGQYNWFVWAAAPFNDAYYCIGRDITSQKEAEEELAVARDALRQSEKMEAIGQLTGGIAHDFNNLLAGISGNLEMLEMRLEQGRLSDLDHYISGAQGSARRAAGLTQRLLAFSRRQTLAPKPTDTNRLIADMEDLIRRTVGPDIDVYIVGFEGLWSTLVDPSQLENALLNLCINARDAMSPDGGRLTIETENKALDARAARERALPPGEYVVLKVTDTGSGMPPDVISQAFDPFFTTKPLGQGTGLGLSMIYGFMRQSGGQVQIYSEVGMGTTMSVYLPRHAGTADAPREVSNAAVAASGRGETVVVIDDEPALRQLMVEVLEDNGYIALEAADGPSGLKLLESEDDVDLLITDVGLPGGMNGRQVADAARVSRPGLKVLFVTGYAENAIVRNGLLDSGMEVMTKPFTMASMGSKIRDLIGR
ncbi:hybrid sensor histidine kinase/response regulator [Pollutimonas subterranea]|uniref:histidine kinase n=2 Tax=Pollutimonas subterranea TaxID=2045210 RepID=A0A2N4U747_9BURK|nr:hybrid sensor histidine kinase/response regulator [Pollutimonas subterranea]